jgi:hypothetical protein
LAGLFSFLTFSYLTYEIQKNIEYMNDMEKYRVRNSKNLSDKIYAMRFIYTCLALVCFLAL